MCVALFLHPMNPAEFLVLAFSAPLQIIMDPNGIWMAWLFWSGLALVLVGVLGWVAVWPDGRDRRQAR